MALTFQTTRRSIGSFDSYSEAQAFVDGLADRRLPVEEVAIVGSDLHFVEEVTGRLTIGKAALAGLGSGAWFGLLLSLFFVLFLPDEVSLLGVMLYWTVLGALIGAAFGGITHALRRGRRDFSSTTSIQPAHFDVQASDELAAQIAPGSSPAR